MNRSIASAPAAAIRQTTAASGQSDERRRREDEAADRRPDRAAEAPRERVDREVAPAKVLGADVGDERLVRRAVEAFADPEDPGREREGEERGRRVEPGAGRVDEEPRDGPEERHQRQRPHPPPPLDPARERQLGEHDHAGVEGEHEPDLAFGDVALVGRELGEEREQRVAGGDEEEVERPEPEEGPVAQHGAVGGGRGRLAGGDARVVDEEEHDRRSRGT